MKSKVSAIGGSASGGKSPRPAINESRGGQKSKLLILNILILLAAAVSFAQGNEEAEFMFAKKAFSDGFYALAQDNLEDFLEKYPSTERLYEAHFLLGRCLYYQNNLKRSSYEFDMALNTPTGAFHDGALYWIGEIYYRNGDFKKALEYYQKVIEQYPASKYLIYALYSKAWVYYRLGFVEDAALAFGDVISRYPFENLAIESHFKIGECEYLLGRHDKAQDSLERFIERYPLSEKIAQAHYIVGDIKIRQAQHEEGINFLNRSLSIAPKAKWAPYVFYRTAEAYFKIGNYDESVKRFDWCVKKGGNDFLAGNSLLGLARNYYEKGMMQEALSSCDEVTAFFPRSDAAAEGYYIKANILNSEKRYKEARDVCLKGIDRFLIKRQTGKLHYELGWIYLKEGRPKDALSEFLSAEKFLDNPALISSALCKIGDIYHDSNDPDKAAQAYDAVLKKYPDSPWYDYAQLRIANIFLKTKKYDQAMLAYQSILANFPSTKFNTEVIFNLGVAYFNKKDFNNAVSAFEKAVRLLPEDTKRGAKYKFYFANSLYNIDRFKDALELFKWLAKNAKDAGLAQESQYQVGWCHYRMNKNTEAADAFNVFLRDYPDSDLADGALYQYAVILSDDGKTEAAAEKLKEFTEKYSQSGLIKTAFRKMANLKKQMSDTSSAIEYFRKALTDENNEANAQVQYEISECLEAKGGLEEAAHEYLKVPQLYSKGVFWAVRADLKAAQIFEKLKRWADAERLYRKLAAMDVEESELAKNRLKALSQTR